MRTHKSHHGGGGGAAPSLGLCINDIARSKAAQAVNAATTTSLPNQQAATEKAKNAATAKARQPAHLNLLVLTAYASAKAASPTRPKRIPTEALAANRGPWSIARNSKIGPVVSGSPISRPPTFAPHFRATSVAAATRSGASVSFKSSIAE